MQSYKLRKNSETNVFPIEYELRLMRETMDENWFKFVWKIFSVIFSGIGTTLICQEDFLPNFITFFLNSIFEKTISSGYLLIITLICELLLFISVASIIYFSVIFIKNNKDKKACADDRMLIIEYFHKVILNNIITGVSFIKKAINYKLLADEREMYICEALFYFKISNQQMREKQIFEYGGRHEYIEFIKEINIVTLENVLKMYERNIEIMKKLDLGCHQGEIDEILKFIKDAKMNLNTVKTNISNINNKNP